MRQMIHVVILILEGVVSEVYTFEDEGDSDSAFELLCDRHGVDYNDPFTDDVEVHREHTVLNRTPCLASGGDAAGDPE